MSELVERKRVRKVKPSLPVALPNSLPDKSVLSLTITLSLSLCSYCLFLSLLSLISAWWLTEEKHWKIGSVDGRARYITLYSFGLGWSCDMRLTEFCITGP